MKLVETSWCCLFNFFFVKFQKFAWNLASSKVNFFAKLFLKKKTINPKTKLTRLTPRHPSDLPLAGTKMHIFIEFNCHFFLLLLSPTSFSFCHIFIRLRKLKLQTGLITGGPPTKKRKRNFFWRDDVFLYYGRLSRWREKQR